MKKIMLLSCTSLFFSFFTFSQQSSYFDPAQAYNRIIIEKNKGAYTQIGNFKVIGTPYLFGEKNTGDIYFKKELSTSVKVNYNTFNQDVEFFQSQQPNTSLTKSPGTLDSFIIEQNIERGLNDDILFVYAGLLGSKEKAYYQLVSKGKNVNLYKKYKSELGIVSTNYVQSELRQYNLSFEYFYTDSSNIGIKKLRATPRQLTNEFAALKNLSSFINADALSFNKELELIRIFNELNK